MSILPGKEHFTPEKMGICETNHQPIKFKFISGQFPVKVLALTIVSIQSPPYTIKFYIYPQSAMQRTVQHNFWWLADFDCLYGLSLITNNTAASQYPQKCDIILLLTNITFIWFFKMCGALFYKKLTVIFCTNIKFIWFLTRCTLCYGFFMKIS